ncbi:MAG TPA: outer membrane beta-barrel protein [Candidatus Acidoferrales bacterium]|nr:outer membrane beta-barrel protein [Candidatus Acidoferrales bacterium]
MLMRKILVLVFVLSCGASCALAQESITQKIELTPFAGTRFGGKINATDSNNPDVDYLTIKSSIDYGAFFDYTIWDNFQAEAMWVRQPSALSEHDFTNDTQTQLTTSDLDSFTFGVAYSFKPVDAKLKPYIAGGLGFTNFTNTDDPNNVFLGFHNRFTYNIGGGVKYYFSKYAGLRFDFRYAPTRTLPQNVQECDQFGNCFVAQRTGHANQGEANLGLIIRF